MRRLLFAAGLLCTLAACAVPLPPLTPDPVAHAAAPLAGLSIAVVKDAELNDEQPSLSAALLHAGFRVVPPATPHHLEIEVTGSDDLRQGNDGRPVDCSSFYSAKVSGTGGELVASISGRPIVPVAWYHFESSDKIRFHDVAAAQLVNELIKGTELLAYAQRKPDLIPGIPSTVAAAPGAAAPAPGSPAAPTGGGAVEAVQVVSAIAQGVQQSVEIAQRSGGAGGGGGNTSGGTSAPPVEHAHVEHAETHHVESHEAPRCAPGERNCRR